MVVKCYKCKTKTRELATHIGNENRGFVHQSVDLGQKTLDSSKTQNIEQRFFKVGIMNKKAFNVVILSQGVGCKP